MKTKLFTMIAALLSVAPAMAQEAATQATAAAGSGNGMIALGAGLAIGLAVIGGGLGQGKIGAAAMDGIARNPQAKLFIPMILALVFVETLVLFTFLVASGLSGKIPGVGQ